MSAEEHPRYEREDVTEGHSFDELAKGLAASEISRRRMLRLFGGAFLGATLGVFGLGRDAEASRRRLADIVLDRALQKLVAMPGGPPGVIAIVQRGESLSVHQFGVADLSNGQSMRTTDHMRIASVSKAFSGATALSLVSTGKLSLDDTIGERLPDLPPAWSEVTLRQLLNHTSGLPDYSQDPGFQDAVGESPAQAPPPEELLTYVYNHDPPLLFDPGSEYRYSNSDNIAVALMVEAATEQSSYEDQLQEQVFGPLGLASTSLPAGADLPEPFIHGYGNDPSQSPPEDVSEVLAAGWAWASGGIVSSPADLNSFIRGYVGGQLFGSETQAQQREVIKGGSSDPPGPGTNAAGLGIFRYDTPCGRVWGHTGSFLGYTQFAAASPDGGRSATVSVNEQLTPEKGAPGVFNALRRAETLAVCAALTNG